MSVQAGTNIKKNYLPVFEEYPEVTGFFSLKDGAVEGSPYNNPEMFRQLRLEDAVRIWPTQIHETQVAVIRQEDIDAAKAAAEAGISLMLEGSALNAGETKNHTQANPNPGDQKRGGQNPGDYSPAIIIPDTDGTITNRKNVLLTTVHADCLAVFCYDPVKEAIGLCHAGWRGTCAGIAMEMVEKMEEEYEILCSICRKYKYRVEYKFDQFFIYTKYEVWCYEIKSGKRILLHGNLLYGKGGIKESGRWHHQKMCGCRSVDDIVKKIHEHEIWKYGGLEFK